MVCFQGAYHAGRHIPLVNEKTWNKVQDILRSHINGERTRKHPHYLKSSIFCGTCGERLLLQICRSKTRTHYPYFSCAGRHAKRTKCNQRSVLVYAIEDAVIEHYKTLSFNSDFRERLEKDLKVELKNMRQDSENEKQSLLKEREKLERKQTKLMEIYYEDGISKDLLASEQRTINHQLGRIIERLQEIDQDFKITEKNLEMALELAEDCYTTYKGASNHIRRQLNQVFFKKIYIGHNNRVDTELNPPFDTIFDPKLRTGGITLSDVLENERPTGVDSCGSSLLSPISYPFTRSSSSKVLVIPAGFEPAIFWMRTRRPNH